MLEVQGLNNVPILQAVCYHAPVERVVVPPVHLPEVPVAAIVGSLVGRHVVPNQNFLQGEMVCVCGGGGGGGE